MSTAASPTLTPAQIAALSSAGQGAIDTARLGWVMQPIPSGGTSPTQAQWQRGAAAQGFLIWNDGGTDAAIGLNQQSVTSPSNDVYAANPLLIVPANSWVSLPVASSQLWASAAPYLVNAPIGDTVPADYSGSVLVLAFAYAPPPGAGSIDGEAKSSVVNTKFIDAEGGVVQVCGDNPQRRKVVVALNAGAADPLYLQLGSDPSFSPSAGFFTYAVQPGTSQEISGFTGVIVGFCADPDGGIWVTEW